MTTPTQLLEELEFNARASNNRPLERRLADLTIWYYQNRNRIPPDNLAARYALADKALWIVLEILALVTERLHESEATSGLWRPKSVQVNGDVRKFG